MLLGVFAFDLMFPYLPAWGIRAFPQSMTLPLILDISYGALAVALGTMVLLLVAAADALDPAKARAQPDRDRPLLKREWGFVSTGTLAGIVILAATAQNQYLGVAGGFASLVGYGAQFFG